MTGNAYDSRCDAGTVLNREDMKTNYTHQLEEVYRKNFASAEIGCCVKILGNLTCTNVLDDKFLRDFPFLILFSSTNRVREMQVSKSKQFLWNAVIHMQNAAM